VILRRLLADGSEKEVVFSLGFGGGCACLDFVWIGFEPTGLGLDLRGIVDIAVSLFQGPWNGVRDVEG